MEFLTWNFWIPDFADFPDQRAKMALSTAEAQTSGQKNGIPEFRVSNNGDLFTYAGVPLGWIFDLA